MTEEPVTLVYVVLHVPLKEPLHIVVPRELRDEYLAWVHKGDQLYLKAAALLTKGGNV